MLFFLFQVFFIFVKKHDCLDLDIGPNTVPTYYIYGNHSIGQTFIARQNNLHRIDIMMGTYDRQSNVPIVFSLFETKGRRNTLLREKNIPAAEVKNNFYYSVYFEPVKESQEKTYLFMLTSPESTEKTAFSAWMNTENIYREGNFVFNGKPASGDLVFRVYSRQNVFSQLRRVLRNYTGIMGSNLFFYFSLVFLEIGSLTMLNFLLSLIIKVIVDPGHFPTAKEAKSGGKREKMLNGQNRE